MSLSKLPKTIYVRLEKDGDDSYLIAGESVDDAVEEEGVTRVGVYKLESTARWTRTVKLVKEG